MYYDLWRATRSDRVRFSTRKYGPHKTPDNLRCTAGYWRRNALQLSAHNEFWGRAAWSPPPTYVLTMLATNLCDIDQPASRDPVLVTPARFCAALLVNVPHPRGAGSAIFAQQTRQPRAKTELVVPAMGQLYVTHDLEIGQEVLADYGDLYASFLM